MLTLRYRAGQHEFIVEAGSIYVKTSDNNQYWQLVARNGKHESDPCIGVWGGRPLMSASDVLRGDEELATIYIMNEAGSTVAQYRYAGAFHQDEPPINPPTEDCAQVAV